MASGEFSSDERSLPEERADPRANDKDLDPAVLESVLRQTLATQDETLSDAQLDALRSAAQRCSGEPFALEPHGVALVAAMLNDQFAASNVATSVIAEVSREVATSLSEVPDVWQRVERLWRNLSETPA